MQTANIECWLCYPRSVPSVSKQAFSSAAQVKKEGLIEMEDAKNCMQINQNRKRNRFDNADVKARIGLTAVS